MAQVHAQSLNYHNPHTIFPRPPVTHHPHFLTRTGILREMAKHLYTLRHRPLQRMTRLRDAPLVRMRHHRDGEQPCARRAKKEEHGFPSGTVLGGGGMVSGVTMVSTASSATPAGGTMTAMATAAS